MTAGPRAPARRSRLLKLEPRVLFDGAAAVDVALAAEAAAPAPAAERPADAGKAVPAAVAQDAGASPASGGSAAAPARLAFVDGSLPEAAAVAAGFGTDTTVVVLASGRDPWQQMSAALAGAGTVAAVHLVSHGDAETLIIDGHAYGAAELTARTPLLASWREHLTDDADLLLYGCRVGADGAASPLLALLAATTGADVAASTDATAPAAQGGNTRLEVATGPLEVAAATLRGLAGPLAATAVTDANAAGTRTTFEDTEVAVSGLAIADSDNPADVTLQVVTTGGTARVTSLGGLAVSAGANGSASFTLRGTLDDVNAALATLRYTPSLDQNSSTAGFAPQIVLTASDLTNGGSGSLTVANFAVIAVNDAPDLSTRVPLAVNEGGSATFTLAQLAASAAQLDPDIATGQQVLAQQMMQITSLPAHGTLKYNDGMVVVGSAIPVANLAGLRYTHDGTDIVATQVDGVGVVVNDGGGGSTAASLVINVAPVNVAPTVGGTPTLLEGQVKNVAPTIAFGDDADTPANATIVIDNLVTGGQGSFFLDANGNNVVDAGEALAGSVTLSAVQRSNLATWFKFAHNGAEPNAPGAIAPSYRVTVTDGGGGTGVPSAPVAATITLAVTPNNDDPTLVNAHPAADSALSVGEGTKSTLITAAMLQLADADRDPADLTQTTPANRLVYTIGTRPAQGEIQVNVGGGLGPESDGWIVLGDGGRFTQAQVDAGQVRYYQTTNVPDGAATADAFTFTARDSAFGYDVWTDPASPSGGREGGVRDTPGGAIATRAFHFSITPLADASTPRPETGYTGGPRPPTPGYGGSSVTYSFEPTAGMPNNNSTETWYEANAGAPGGGYAITSAMLSYTITRTDSRGTPDPADDVSVVVSPAETVYTLTAPPSNGSLQRLVGASWQTITAYTQFTQADIDAGRIRFVHDGSEKHVANFSYRVSDGTPNSLSASFGIDMTPVNDRPVASDGGAVVTEGSGNAVRLGTGAVGMSDADGSADGKTGEGSVDFLWFRLASLPAAGSVERWNGTAWVAATTAEWLPRTLLTASADGATSGLRYVHDGSEPLAYAGGPRVSFSFVVRDDLADPGAAFVTDGTTPADTSGSAQSNQSAAATITVEVIPVNNPPQIADTPGAADPTLSGALVTGAGALTGVNETIAGVAEGATFTIGAAYLTAVDPDHTTVQRQYRIMSAPTLGTLLLNGKALGAGSTFTQDDIDNNRLAYRNAGAEVGAATVDATLGTYHDKFHFVVSDGVAQDSGAGASNYNTALITLEPANDKATVAAPAALDVLASGGTAVAVPGVSVSDVDLDWIVAGAEEDFIRVELAVLTAGNAAVAGAALGFSAADPSASARSLVSGRNTNALVLQGARDEVNAALASLTVAFSSDEDSATHKIRVTVDDRLYTAAGALAGGANGGAVNSDGSAINAANNRASRDIALRASNVNDAPTITNASSYSVNEDVLLTLSGFTLADADSFDGAVTVKVELFSDATRTTLASAAGEGALTYAGLAGVTAGGTGTNTVTLSGTLADVQTALNALRFDNAADYNGPGAGNGRLYLRTTFTDFGHADVPAGNVVTVDNTIDIVPVNDAPVLGVPGNKTLSSGTYIDITSGFSVQDSKDVGQGASDQVAVTVAATVGGAASGAISIQAPGAATIGGDGTATVTVSGSAAAVQAALNSLRYTPGSANLDAAVLMSVTADDRTAGVGNGTEGVGVDGNNTASGSFTIDVSATNDAPVPSAPATLTVAEDSATNAVAGVSFTDADDFGGSLRVTLAVDHGTVDLTTRSGLTVVAGGYGTATLTVSGTKANLNTALGSLKYTPSADYHGSDSLAFTVNDQGLTGSGGAQSATATVAITVTPVNDRPTAGSNATLAAVPEDSANPAGSVASTLTFSYADATDDQTAAGGNSSATAFSYLAVVGNAASAAQGVWQLADGAGGWITAPTSGLALSSALIVPSSRAVRFVPAADFFGTPGALTVRLADASVDLAGTGKLSTSAATRFDLTLAANGGTTTTGAWNAVDRTIGVSVSNVNDRPTAAAATLAATVEDALAPAGATVASLGFSFADAVDNQTGVSGGGDARGSFGGIAVVGNAALAAEGVWQYNDNAGSGWVAIGSGGAAPADAAALRLPTAASLRFLPAANFNGTPGALSVRVADSAQSFAAAADLSAALDQTSTWSAAVALTTQVASRNDAPTFTHAATDPTVTENGTTGGAVSIDPVALLGAGTVADLDLTSTGALVAGVFGAGSITATLTDGMAGDSLSVAGVLPAGVTTGGGAAANALVITLDADTTTAEVKSLLEALRYRHVGDNPTDYGSRLTRSYTVVLSDGNNVQAGGNAGGPTALAAATVNGTLTLVATNDPPVATDDAASVTEDTASTATGNVKTGVGGTLDTDPDNTNAQLSVTAIRTGAEAGAGTAGTPGVALAGAYGTLTINADGGYTYDLDNANATVNALTAVSAPLTDTFTYTLSDGAATDRAELVITINGSDDGGPTVVAVDGNAAQTGQATVREQGLVDAGGTHIATGTLTVTAAAGLSTLTVGGSSFSVAQLAAFTSGSPSAVIDTGEGELRLTGLTVTAGAAAAPTAATVSYVYTLKARLDHSGGGAIERTDPVALAVSDTASAANSGTLTVVVIDDVPTAVDDAAAITRGSAAVGGNAVTAGSGRDRLGADVTPTPVTAIAHGLAAGVVGSPRAGAYGSLTLGADGAFSYAPNNANPAVAALRFGQRLVDTFTYVITDADGDSSTAAIRITINGANDGLPLAQAATATSAPPRPPVPLSQPIVSASSVVPRAGSIGVDHALHVLNAVAEARELLAEIRVAALGDTSFIGRQDVSSPALEMAADPALRVLSTVGAAREEARDLGVRLRAATGTEFSSTFARSGIGSALDSPGEASAAAATATDAAPAVALAAPETPPPAAVAPAVAADAADAARPLAAPAHRGFSAQLREASQRQALRGEAVRLARALAAERAARAGGA